MILYVRSAQNSFEAESHWHGVIDRTFLGVHNAAIRHGISFLPILPSEVKWEATKASVRLIVLGDWAAIDEFSDSFLAKLKVQGTQIWGYFHGSVREPLSPAAWPITDRRSYLAVAALERSRLDKLDGLLAFSAYTARRLHQLFSSDTKIVVTVPPVQMPPVSRLVGSDYVLVSQRPHGDKIPQILALLVGDRMIGRKFVWSIPKGRDISRDVEQLFLQFPDQVEVKYISHRDQYLELLRRASAVFTSSGYDHQSFSCLEALSIGIPVVAPRAFGFPEVVAAQNLYEPYCVQQIAKVLDKPREDYYKLSPEAELLKQFIGMCE